MRLLVSLMVAGLCTIVLSTWAGDAPAEIKRGTLHASSGPFASISMPVHYGLKLWIDQKNAEGSVYVKTFDHKIPIKIVAYDDQSSTPAAATLYNHHPRSRRRADLRFRVRADVGGCSDRARTQNAADRPNVPTEGSIVDP